MAAAAAAAGKREKLVRAEGSGAAPGTGLQRAAASPRLGPARLRPPRIVPPPVGEGRSGARSLAAGIGRLAALHPRRAAALGGFVD